MIATMTIEEPVDAELIYLPSYLPLQATAYSTICRFRAFLHLLYPVAAVAKEGLGVFGCNCSDARCQSGLELIEQARFDSTQ